MTRLHSLALVAAVAAVLMIVAGTMALGATMAYNDGGRPVAVQSHETPISVDLPR